MTRRPEGRGDNRVAAPLSVVQTQSPQPQVMQALRNGTDNLPILTQPAMPGSTMPHHDYTGLNTPSVWRSARSQAAAKVDALASHGMDEIEIPAFLRKQAE